MNRPLLAGVTLALLLAVTNASAQSAPSAAALAAQAKRFETDLRKQLERAVAMKREAEAAAAAKAAAQQKHVVSAADATTLSSVASAGGLSMDVKGLSLEAAMLMIQTTRANSLEGQLKAQLAAVQARNDSLAKVNTVLRALIPIAARFPANARADAATKDYVSASDIALWQKTAKDAGVSTADISTKASVEKQIRVLKDRIDSLSTAEQTDMLRLQSLTSKQNEAFESMTNLMKKSQEQQKGIISNIRP